MMISFWSPVKDELVSGIAVLMATAGCKEFSCKVVLTDNYVGRGNIGSCLFGEAYNRFRKDYDRARSECYERGDSFIRFLRKETGKAIGYGRTLEILSDQLYFLPLNQSLRSDIYEYGFDREFPDILDFCEARFDFLLLNTESRGNLSTKTILNCADQVVILLPTAEWMVDILMEEYASVLQHAVIVFHGQPDSGFLRRMKRKYSAFRNKMLYLPVTEEAKEAIREGKIVEYYERVSEKCREGDTDPVMQKLRYITFSVMRKEKRETKLRYEEMRALFEKRNRDPFSKKYSLPSAESYVAEQETDRF